MKSLDLVVIILGTSRKLMAMVIRLTLNEKIQVAQVGDNQHQMF